MSQASVVVLDTETTGLDCHKDRVIEIGAIKMIGGKPVTKFHTYLNPEGVTSHPDAVAVHGITNEFLLDKPTFEDVKLAFLEFVEGSDLVIHNAPFDIGFLNAELCRSGYQAEMGDICKIIDTLVLAKKKYPGQKNSLDALCKRFGIANSHRTLHGALLDADLLVKVYLQMCVDQSDFLSAGSEVLSVGCGSALAIQDWDVSIEVIQATEEEEKSHRQFFE